jgi:CelD/BcsL family acetyltransferase involved in cellulose biosynthesis
MSLPGIDRFVANAHGIPLATPWETHALSRMGKAHHDDTRKKLRRLHRLGTVELCHGDTPDLANRIYTKLVQHRLARFRHLGREDALADPVWSGFYDDTVKGHTTMPSARLMALCLDGDPIAQVMGFERRGVFAMVMTSFDMERFPTLSVGRLINYEAMRHFADRGSPYFDLTIGDEPYKRQLGCDDRPLYEVMFASSTRGGIAVAMLGVKRWLRRRPVLHARLRRLAGKARPESRT